MLCSLRENLNFIFSLFVYNDKNFIQNLLFSNIYFKAISMKLIRQCIESWYVLENKFLPDELKGRDVLITWKERAAYLSFLCFAIFGFIALVPSLIMAYQRDLMVIFVMDMIAYAVVVIFLLSTRFSLKLKSWIALIVVYSLGIVLLFTVGFYGAGYIWLFGASMFGTVLFRNKYVGLILLANFLVLLSVGAYIVFGFPGWHYLLENPKEIWLILTVNFMVVNVLIVFVAARAKSNIDEAVIRQVDAQNSLVEEKEFSDYIIQSIPGLFFLFERRPDDQMLLKRWNENFSLILEYPNEGLKNLTTLQFFEKKNYSYIKRKHQQLFEQGQISFEIEIKTKSGRLIPVYMQAHGFKKDERYYMVGTAIDISARMAEAKEKERMQKSLAASQKASALGTLSSGIAHDFNNILSGIRGYAELIQMAPDDQKNVEKGVDQILNGSNRARELVQQILTFSRGAESQKMNVKPYLVVKEAIKFMRSSIPAPIEIKEKIETKGSIHADATQMHQLVMNLCTNAYHSMRQTGGTLTVELSEVEISETDQIGNLKVRPGAYMRIKVSDTGHGMEQDTIDRIFEPYFTTKESVEGTGLGLAVVQGIVKEHQGYINVVSRLNEGTCFDIYFPMYKKSRKPSSPEKSIKDPVTSKNAEKILLADDEEGIRVFMQSLFEDYGYYVETFPNGEEALKRFNENPDFFDLLITDIAMPKMAGNQLIEEIFKTRKDMPVIVHTGYAESFDEDKAHKTGVRKYFQKPTDAKNLLLAIQNILKPL